MVDDMAVRSCSVLAIQADGKIVAAGWWNNKLSHNDNFALVRYNPDGNLDAKFGASGKMTTAIGNNNDRAYGVAIQGDGKIVAVGYSIGSNSYDFAITRYLP